MNENELDEVLGKWQAPEAPASLREGVRTGFRDLKPRRFPQWTTGFLPRVLATGVVGCAILAVIATRAVPQTGPVPYVVESRMAQFYEDGSEHEVNITSYNRDGSEVLISMYQPESVLGTMFGQLVRSVHGMTPRDLTAAQMAKRTRFANVYTNCYGHGCFFAGSHSYMTGQELLASRCEGEGQVVGHETILGYPAVAIEKTFGGEHGLKVTLWRAPGLGCFALRVKTESLGSNGQYRTTDLKQALKITAPGKL